MGSEFPMASRAEITTKDAKAHVTASKKDRWRILAQVVVAVTGWSRDNRRLVAAAKQPPGTVDLED